MKKPIQFFLPLVGTINLLLLVTLISPLNPIDASSNISQNQTVIGIVSNGTFIDAETKDSKNLTSIDMVEQLPSESGSLDLTQYEGMAIFVTTFPGASGGEGEWLYSANITNVGSPIISKLVKKIYGFE